MTTGADGLDQVLSTYSAGLDGEIALLNHLEQLAARLREATAANDLEGLTRLTDERTRLLQGLVALEHDLKPLRARLVAEKTSTGRLAGFDAVAARHREAASLVAGILTTDQRTMESLKEAEQARRFAAQTIEAGETTLAAYRRVVAPRPTAAAIVDERG